MKSKSVTYVNVRALILSFFVLASPCIFAQTPIQAVIRELAGTVEIKRPGSDAWVAASRGQVLTGDTAISTGFRSTVVVNLGNSVVTLRPLTRLTVTELSHIQDTEKVELNLQTGRVRANITAPEGGRTEFNVKSSHATNSVRGTVFEFDTLNLSVAEGTVEFSGITGAPHLVDAGGFSQVDEYTGWVSVPALGATAGLTPDLPIASEPIQVATQPQTPAIDLPEIPPVTPPPTPPAPPADPTQPSAPPTGPSPPTTEIFTPVVIF